MAALLSETHECGELKRKKTGATRPGQQDDTEVVDITSEEVERALGKMKNGKAVGPEN